jgi:hypothetical protein
MRRSRGYDFGATSENPEGLSRDDGGVRDRGVIDEDHIDCRPLNRPTRGSGFSNPEGDYGPDTGRDHIDESSLQSPQWAAGQGYTKQADRSELASVSRARASSADEWWGPEAYYGGPSRRGG